MSQSNEKQHGGEDEMSDRLLWVNDESTVMVERYEDGSTIFVATREDSDGIWGPPIACKADPETAKVMGLSAEITQAVAGEWGMGDN